MKHKMQTINKYIGKTNFHKVIKQFTTEKMDVLIVVTYKKILSTCKIIYTLHTAETLTLCH